MVQALLKHLLPATCAGCDEIVDQPGGFCPNCWADIYFLTGLNCRLCSAPLPGDNDQEVACDRCLADPPNWHRGFAVAAYDGVARRMVLGLKHGDRHDLVSPMVNWMKEKGPDVFGGDPIFVPVPLHWRRLVSRKFNQSALIAQALGRELDLTCLLDGLLRKRATKPLEGHNRQERFVALEDAIVVNAKHATTFENRRIVIIDDVMTSGATLRASTKAFEKCHTDHINVLVLAREGNRP